MNNVKIRKCGNETVAFPGEQLSTRNNLPPPPLERAGVR